MEHLFVSFKIKKEYLEQAKRIIIEFVDQIKNNESGTLTYKCFQEKADSTSFIHVMTFQNEEAEELHRHTDYVKKFIDKLYPMCEKEPEFSELNLICSNYSKISEH
jgi:quinol monooxygenase YgiN